MTKATAFRTDYTNETTEELLREMNEPRLSEEYISSIHPMTAEAVRESQAYDLLHPIIGIRRVATEGSQSKRGGEIRKGSLDIQIDLPNGGIAKVAMIGDQVAYPDGSTARIITGAGESFFNTALVGSRLENGDEIINTPQEGLLLNVRRDVQLMDFLPEVGRE